MDAAKNRQMELKVGVNGVAAGLDLGLDGLEGGLDPHEVVACATLGGEAGGFDLHAHPEFEDLQHVLCGLHFVRIDTERPALHVRRHERAKPLARHHQAVGSERSNGFAHHRAADAGGEREFLFGRQARARLEPSAEDLGGKPLRELLGPIERRAKRQRDRFAFLHGFADRLSPDNYCANAHARQGQQPRFQRLSALADHEGRFRQPMPEPECSAARQLSLRAAASLGRRAPTKYHI